MDKEYTNFYNKQYKELALKNIIYPKIKIELLDPYENVIGEITKDLSEADEGSISINYQQGVRRSCSLTIINPQSKYLDLGAERTIFGFNSKFKLYTGLFDPVTRDTYWFSQGVYYTTNPNASHNGISIISLQGVDKFGFLTSDSGYNQLEGTYIVPQGSKVSSAVRDILTLDLGNNQIIDPIEPLIDRKFKDYILPFDIKKGPGEYLGDILIEIASILGADIFYDVNGRLNIVSGTTDISYSYQSSIWDYTDVLPEYMDSSVSLNTVEAINIVKVVGTEVNDGLVYIGSAENHNPLSPTAIEKIGRKTYYEEGANLPNQTAADEYAKYVLNIKSIIQTSINFSSTLVPHLDVNRVITIEDKYYNYQQERFIIQSITMPIGITGKMSISCNNIASLPYYELRNGGN